MAQDHLKSPMVKRRGRRRRPSLDNLLRQHSEEIALGVGLAPDEEELQDDAKRGLKALFELVGNGSEHLRVGHINPFLEKLGVFMDSGKVSDLFKLHQLQLSPAEAEAPLPPRAASSTASSAPIFVDIKRLAAATSSELKAAKAALVETGNDYDAALKKLEMDAAAEAAATRKKLAEAEADE